MRASCLHSGAASSPVSTCVHNDSQVRQPRLQKIAARTLVGSPTNSIGLSLAHKLFAELHHYQLHQSKQDNRSPPRATRRHLGSKTIVQGRQRDKLHSGSSIEEASLPLVWDEPLTIAVLGHHDMVVRVRTICTAVVGLLNHLFDPGVDTEAPLCCVTCPVEIPRPQAPDVGSSLGCL